VEVRAGRQREGLAAPTPTVGTETTLVEPNGTYRYPIELLLCNEFTTGAFGDQTVVSALVPLSGLLRLHFLHPAPEQCWFGNVDKLLRVMRNSWIVN
jgi:hypothetical protein